MRSHAAKRKANVSAISVARKADKPRQRGMAIIPANPARYSLQPGEIFLGEEVAHVETLLGSCVAVAMYAPRLRVGALSHSLLPICRSDGPCLNGCLQGPRYVDCAIQRMLEWFVARGVKPRQLVVKLFGGSDMFSAVEESLRKGAGLGIGRQNIERALQVIKQEGLHLTASDVGGLEGRKIIFRTYTGEVFLKRLSRSELK